MGSTLTQLKFSNHRIQKLTYKFQLNYHTIPNSHIHPIRIPVRTNPTNLIKTKFSDNFKSINSQLLPSPNPLIITHITNYPKFITLSRKFTPTKSEIYYAKKYFNLLRNPYVYHHITALFHFTSYLRIS